MAFMILTHVLRCSRWYWEWLTYEEWAALPHVTRAAAAKLAAIGFAGHMGCTEVVVAPPVPPGPRMEVWQPAPPVVTVTPYDQIALDREAEWERATIERALTPVGRRETRGVVKAEPVPEPGTLALLAIGIAGVVVARRKQLRFT